MIAQPNSIPTSAPAGSVEQELLQLRATVAEALGRIQVLEQRLGGSDSADRVAETTNRPLIPLDSPAMTAAIALCAEVFPGSRTKLEVLSDPDDPERMWRLITVYWSSSVREAIDQQSIWHNRFDVLHPEAIHDISLFVVPE